jgi:D-arginine dehydrogenase
LAGARPGSTFRHVDLPKTADVIVIGAGIAGTSVAWHLAPHLDVLVLEQGDQPGAEATAQNAGMIRRLGGHDCERALSMRTHRWLLDPPDDFPEGIARTTGAVLGFAEEMGLLDGASVELRRAGISLETCLRPPELAPGMAGCPTLWAWYLPDEQVADPHGLVTGFVRGLRRNGGRLACGVRVLDVAVEGGQVRGVTTDQGFVATERVVLAAGAWSGVLAAGMGLDRPHLPLARTLLHTRPHPLSHADHPWCWVEDVGVYIKPEGGGWLISGCEEAPTSAPVGPGSAGPVDELPRAMILDKATRMYPALGDLRLQGGWTGLRTFTWDRRPYLGSDHEVDGLWWATALGGSGVTCSAGLGEAVSTWMLGGQTDWIDRDEVSTGRPLPTRAEFEEAIWRGGERPDVPVPDEYEHDPYPTTNRRR